MLQMLKCLQKTLSTSMLGTSEKTKADFMRFNELFFNKPTKP